MANASITTPQGTKAGNFDINITLDVGVTDFTSDKIAITAIHGNGITGVTFEILPDTDMNSATYNVVFQLPAGVEGALQIDISGMVTREGGSSPEGVMANSLVVTYDTTENIAVTFGTVEYRDGGVVVLPVTFAENVIAPSKTVFPISRVSGDSLDGMGYYIVGEDAAYELIFEVPPDRSGSFSVGADGYVPKENGVWDNVTGTLVTVAYSTVEPQIVDYDIPASYDLGAPVDVRIAYKVPITGWNLNNTLTDIFILEGAKLGTPLPYKWTGTSPPDIHAPMPADLTGTDWTLLTQPDPNLPRTAENGFDENDIWHGEEGQYFLIRFPDPQEIGIFNLTPRDGKVRGPVGG